MKNFIHSATYLLQHVYIIIYRFNMFLQSIFSATIKNTIITLLIFSFFMNTFYVSVQVSRSAKRFSTHWTFIVILISFMNSFHMSLQILFVAKFFGTILTGLFDPLMNCFHVNFQVFTFFGQAFSYC